MAAYHRCTSCPILSLGVPFPSRKRQGHSKGCSSASRNANNANGLSEVHSQMWVSTTIVGDFFVP